MKSSRNRTTGSSSRAAVRRAAVETLEARQMLSVSVEKGILSVTGTSGPDTIIVSRDLKRPGVLVVNVNGFRNSAPERGLKAIQVNALEGSDRVSIDQSYGRIFVPVNLIGGRGDDTLSGGFGDDVIQGGPGDDMIRGGGGNDLLAGHAGNDKVFGGLGRDDLRGDGGTDVLYTGGEQDTANTGNNAGDSVDTTVPMMKPSAKAGGAITPFVLDNTYDPVDGLSPDQLRLAYGLGAVGDGTFTNRGQGQTIAIVNAYHAPTIRQDLDAYSAEFGLPAITRDNFQVYYASKVQPAVDLGWSGESTLDVQSAHAIAPDAKIIMVEAATASPADMIQAVQRAAELVAAEGGGVVSMSFGQYEFFALDYDYIYGALPANVSLVAASGDDGASFGVSYPASSPFVTAVGGTSLFVDAAGNRTAPEVAWAGSGGGLSLSYGRPVYQANTTVGGLQFGDYRGVPDISFNADPLTGIAIYSTTESFPGSDTGWMPVGGTSAGSPAIAGFVALINQRRAENGLDPIGTNLNNAIYRAARRDQDAYFIDIDSGSNGYAAVEGYDLATGWGSPNGTAFIDAIAADTSTAASNLQFEEARLLPDPSETRGRVVHMLFGGSGFASDDGSEVLLDIVPNASSGVSISVPDALTDNGDGTFSTIGQVDVQLDAKSHVSYLTKFVARVERRNRRDYIVGEFFAVSRRGKIIHNGDKAVFYGSFVG